MAAPLAKSFSARRGTLIGMVCGLGAASIWGGMYVVSDAVLEVVPPFTLLAARLLLGAVALGVIVVRRGEFFIPRAQVWPVLGAGFVGYGCSLGLQFVGTRLSTAANGALITSTTPAFVLLFAAWLLGERITPRRLTALALATAGVLIVINPRSASLAPDLFWGNVLLAGAGLTWALYSVLVRRVTRAAAVVPVTFLALLGGLPSTLVASAWEWPGVSTDALTFGVLAGVVYLGVVSTALAPALWTRAFVELEAGVASLTFFAQPVVGAVLSAWLLGERLGAPLFFGGIMIGIGVWLTLR